MASEVRGVDVVVNGLENFGLEVREAAFYAVIEALQKTFQACYHLLSESDHTLMDLARMGHPYSLGGPKRSGAEPSTPAVIHDPDVIVHYQDTMGGKQGPQKHYRDCLEPVSPRGMGGEIVEGKIINTSPLDTWIQDGTTKMRARPWMEWVVKHYGNDLADLIEARITAAIKSQEIAA